MRTYKHNSKHNYFLIYRFICLCIFHYNLCFKGVNKYFPAVPAISRTGTTLGHRLTYGDGELEVLGDDSVCKCRRVSQPSWLLGTL